MKYVVIGVFDALLEAAMPIQCIQPMEDEDIIESHRRAVKMGKIPVDMAVNYVLFKYGTFDDKTGEFDLLETPKKLVALADFCPKKVEVEQSGTNQSTTK